MRTFAWSCLALALAASLSACTPEPLKKMGAACTAASQCGTGICQNGICTTVCFGQSDCAVGLDCGLASPTDTDATCYVPKYARFDKGGIGTDCSTVAADPKTGTACTSDASPCQSGLTCLSSRKCDPTAFCTAPCASDLECPHTMFCGVSPTDKNAHVCLRRAFCEPCITDDQCSGGSPTDVPGVSWVCAADAAGGRFCARLCKDDMSCPQPANDQQSFPLGAPFQTCQKDKLHPGAIKVCKPANNLCHGASAVKSVKGDGTYCSMCRAGIPSDCASGFSCYFDEFTTERFCSKSCSIDIRFVNNHWVEVSGSDTCADVSPDLHCTYGDNPPCTKTPCTVQSLCSADPIDRTCYPLAM